jgi:hypothetical protein
MQAMKQCTKCGRKYDDPSIMFCTEDGIPLTPRFDSEAETVKVPEWSPVDIQMEIADYLIRLQLRVGEQRLVRFEDLKHLGLTANQISENFSAAVRQVNFELVNQTDTRAIICRPPPPETGSFSVKTTPVW